MSRHYFQLQDGKWGVIMSVKPLQDLDILTFGNPNVNRIHETNIDLLGDVVSRGWSGRVTYEDSIITYSIVERPNLYEKILDFVVTDDISEKSLDDKVNEL